MPPALMSHASMPGVSPTHQLQQVRDVPREVVAPKKDPAVCPTDDEAQIPRPKESKDKRSLDYVWRSGVAGGMAGCAVGGSCYSDQSCRGVSC